MLLRHIRFNILFILSVLVVYASGSNIFRDYSVARAAESTMNISSIKIGLSYVREFSLGFTYIDSPDSRTLLAGISPTAQRLVAYNPHKHQFWVFDLAGRKVASFGKTGMRPGEFMTPSGLAFDQNGYLLVADEDIPVIRRYRLDGQYVDDAVSAVPGVTGWSDVTWRNGVITASPSIFNGFRNKQGARVFIQGKPQQICKQCFGPIALAADDLVYLVDKMTPPSEPVLPHLMVLSQKGKTILRTAFPMVGIINDIQYWPEVDGLITTYLGKDMVLLIRDKGRKVEKLLDIAQKTLLTILPMQKELFVVHTDGKVVVYKLQTTK